MLAAGVATFAGCAIDRPGTGYRLTADWDQGGQKNSNAFDVASGLATKLAFTAQPGDITITPRATDDKNNTQYDISQQKWNQLGYIFGAMVPHPVKVV